MKKYLIIAGAVAAFLIGYSTTSAFAAYPAGGVNGRAEHRGYFSNSLDDEGGPVLRRVYDGEAIRPDVTDADSFINFILYTKLDIDGNGSGDTRDKTGAAFLINSMLGTAIGSRTRPPTSGQIADWSARIRYLDAWGKISWRTSYSFTINSYWQGEAPGPDPNDDAYYDESATADAIVFRNLSNQVVFAIKWYCANPVGTGNLGPIPNDPSFNILGGSYVSDSTVVPGQTITFNHNLKNTGSTSTSPHTITWRTYNTISGAQVASGNAGTFSAGQTKNNVSVENYTVPASATPGSQICRRLYWTPDTQLGGSQYTTPICATVQYDFTLSASINVLVNGSPPAGGTAEAGDTISFTYVVTNTGSSASQSVSCNVYRVVADGSYSPPSDDSASSPSGYVPPALGCPRTFPVGPTILNGTPETITNVLANKTYCQAFWINPASYGGPPDSTEACIKVVAKPYLKVYGGDVSVGGAVESAPYTCTADNNASIVGWNRATAGYPGAGVQYAAFALSKLLYFASAQSAGSSAAAPTSLSFANTGSGVVNTGSGLYGGSFGSAPCIHDYYAGKPSTATTLGSSSVSTTPLTDKDYQRSGYTTITGGVVNPGQRTTLYVDGDVYITNNITYPGSWSYSQIPMFRLVARGNIYIAPNVTALDGVYIAQNTTASNGTIYTCAPGGIPPALGGNFYSDCSNKLTVNGSFVARNIELLRNRGSLAQSSSDGGPGTSNAAEEFNYNPAFWIAQPNNDEGANNYDAITSLPPVL